MDDLHLRSGSSETGCAVWESYADRVQLFTDPRETEPAERLQFVSRLALRSVEFTLLRRGRRIVVRRRLRRRGPCGRKGRLAMKLTGTRHLQYLL